MDRVSEPSRFRQVQRAAVALQETLRIALDTLRSHKLRTFLTLLGVILAVTTLVAVISVLNGLNVYVSDKVANLGANALVVDKIGIVTNLDQWTKARKRPPLDIWRDVLNDHPKRGEVAPAAQKIVDELFAFIRERRLVDLPQGERVVVAPAPAYDLGLASMHSSPPLEPHPVKSFYYITDAQAAWPLERQNAWLQKFNYATLTDITAHEVAPGHYVHSLFMRRTPGKIRRIWIGLNPFPQPSSGQDGWAHYAEQLVSDEGFKKDDPRYRLAQTSEALTRICRLISGLRLHSGEWSIDRAAQLFEVEAHLPPPAARQEAIRGTYDPTYGGYFLGKMAVLKLRRDVQASRGDAFNLREFHERVMSNGIAPWWAHRQLLMPGDRGPVVE